MRYQGYGLLRQGREPGCRVNYIVDERVQRVPTPTFGDRDSVTTGLKVTTGQLVEVDGGDHLSRLLDAEAPLTLQMEDGRSWECCLDLVEGRIARALNAGDGVTGPEPEA